MLTSQFMPVLPVLQLFFWFFSHSSASASSAWFGESKEVDNMRKYLRKSGIYDKWHKKSFRNFDGKDIDHDLINMEKISAKNRNLQVSVQVSQLGK